jgi:hypothetical protein
MQRYTGFLRGCKQRPGGLALPLVLRCIALIQTEQLRTRQRANKRRGVAAVTSVVGSAPLPRAATGCRSTPAWCVGRWTERST